MNRTRSHTFRTAGLGLVELLLALAISAMLLTSVAIAFHTSLDAMDENQKIALATQNARVILNRMMTEVRRAEAVECVGNRVSILPPDDGSGVLLTGYELVNGTLWYRQNVGTGINTYPILTPDDGITINSFEVYATTGVDGEGVSYTQSITALLDLQVGDNRFAVTASTNPRQNIDW